MKFVIIVSIIIVLLVLAALFYSQSAKKEQFEEHEEASDEEYDLRMYTQQAFETILGRKPSSKEIEKYSKIGNNTKIMSAIKKLAKETFTQAEEEKQEVEQTTSSDDEASDDDDDNDAASDVSDDVSVDAYDTTGSCSVEQQPAFTCGDICKKTKKQTPPPKCKPDPPKCKPQAPKPTQPTPYCPVELAKNCCDDRADWRAGKVLLDRMDILTRLQSIIDEAQQFKVLVNMM